MAADAMRRKDAGADMRFVLGFLRRRLAEHMKHNPRYCDLEALSEALSVSDFEALRDRVVKGMPPVPAGECRCEFATMVALIDDALRRSNGRKRRQAKGA